jgi:RNA polymerase sigma-70 factor (ECF subfamily)
MPKVAENSISTVEFGKLFSEDRLWFVSIAHRFVRDAQTAEDIVSDSFMSFWENRDALPADVNVRAYILTTVKNRCLTHLRKKLTRARIEKEMHSTGVRMLMSDIHSLSACNPDEILSGEIDTMMTRATQKMSPTARTVFHKSRHDGKTYKEIADEMKIAVTHVHWEMSRALQILRTEFKDYLPVFLFLFCFF